MAIIGKIRKRSGLLVIIIGIALAAFVLGDFLNPGKGQRRLNNIGVVSGENITYNEFAQKVEEQLENMKQRSQTDKLTAEENFQARQMTWNQMVREMVMNEQYKNLGVSVSSDELFDLVQGKNPHQYILQYFKDPNTNQYNPQLVINFLKQLDQIEPEQKKNWLILEKAIKDDRLQTKYNNLLSKSYYLPKVFVQKDFEEKNRKFHLRVVADKYQNIDDKTVVITDADYQKYYDEHKYKFYQDEETRDLDFITFDLVASQQDREKIAKDVAQTWDELQKVPDVPAFVNAYSDTKYDSSWHKQGKFVPSMDSIIFNSPVGTFIPPFVENNAYQMGKILDIQLRPDSLKANHILISYKGSAANDPKITRTKEKAKATCDSILEALKKDVNQFPAIAAKMSDDASNKAKGGDLGWFNDGAMVYPFNQACIEGKVGEVKQVETVFGYHIIQIAGKTNPYKKVRVAVIDRKIEPSSQTIQQIYTQASEFAGENTTREAFDKSVTAKGFNKRSADGIRSMESTLPGLMGARNIVQWAFMEETEKGGVSTVFEIQGSYVVAALKEIRPKGILPLDLVKKQIEPLVKREKKAEKLIAAVKAAGTSDLYQLATKINSKVDTIPGVFYYSPNLPKYGPEPELIGTISTMSPGKPTDPLKGEQAVYVIQIDSISEAPKNMDMSGYTMQNLQMFQSKVMNEAYKALEKMSDVEDNRVRFY
ncbi:MAG: SurA N-terminal domain-containing protein [Bacteroidales bacterium]